MKKSILKQIIKSRQSQTKKIIALLKLGLTRKQIRSLENANFTNAQTQAAYQKYIKNFDKNQSLKEKIGIEIELLSSFENEEIAQAISNKGVNCLSQRYNHNTISSWKIVNDGSIMSLNLKGMEVVSPPLNPSEVKSQLEKVTEVLKQKNCKINKTCGLHIHFNATDLTLENWKFIYKNYYLLEKQIDSFMPESRRKNSNTYCKGFNGRFEKTSRQNFEQQKFFEKIDSASSVSEIGKFVSKSSSASRYFKINTNSFIRHNTIEFRQHSGTVEFEKIYNWILFLNNLIEFSKQNLYIASTEFRALYKLLPTNVYEFYKSRKAQLV